MLQKNNYKICLVGDSLSGGGAERAQAFLSDYFEAKGVEVHHIIVQDKVTYNYSGKLLNLGKLKNSSNGLLNKWKRLTVLKQYLQENHFNFIIDFRIRTKPVQDFIISKFIYNSPVIFSVHSSCLNWYMPTKPWLTRLIYSNSYAVQSISVQMKNIIEENYNLKNVVTIYNAVNTEYIALKLAESCKPKTAKYIVAAGRMDDDVKQFDRLIISYSNSVLPLQNISLLILGDGHLKEQYIQAAASAGVAKKVVFMGFQENPYSYMKNALFFILCSKFEGMPMVMLEALACGTPVISFNCISGPSEIIAHENNGLLIKDQDFDELTVAMNRMHTDERLYNYCKQNAVKSIEKFSLDTIGQQWLKFLKIRLN